MKKSGLLNKLFAHVFLPFFMVVFISGCGGDLEKKWKEEVVLSDGRAVWVERTATMKTGGEIGGPGFLDGLQSTMVASPQLGLPALRWEFPFAPILLDYSPIEKKWTVIATFYDCDSWYKLGRPKLPYVQYVQYANGWKIVPLGHELIGRKSNLISGIVRNEMDVVSNEYGRKLDAGAAEEYRVIVPEWSTGC
jgi:hypothetical protein